VEADEVIGMLEFMDRVTIEDDEDVLEELITGEDVLLELLVVVEDGTAATEREDEDESDGDEDGDGDTDGNAIVLLMATADDAVEEVLEDDDIALLRVEDGALDDTDTAALGADDKDVKDELEDAVLVVAGFWEVDGDA